MAKIIKIDEETNIVSIGTDDGKIKEVRQKDFTFKPEIGDIVEIFETETNTIVSKKEIKETNKENQSTNGIHINLNNSNNTVPQSPIYVANNTKAVNKVIYCILAFFFGSIGIHKFYAGKISSGVLYFIFCWTFIPAIIAFIEFIIAVCKKPDAMGNILV